MKKLFFLLLILFLTPYINAQNFRIGVFEAYENKNPETFGNMWQSLTSEVYLMNMNFMDKLVDEVYFRNKKKRAKSSVRSVFITAKFDGTAVFNGVEYPLYRFRSGKDGKFSDLKNNNSMLRIIDAMPVSAVLGNNAEESIEMQLELSDMPDIVSDFSSKQLKTLSSNTVATPINAMKAYIKEISSLLNQNMDKSSLFYSFSTPINISNEETPGKKVIYSIAVYFFKPELSDDAITFGGKVKEDLDSLLRSNAQNINPGHLNSIMGYQNYPYIVCVNYKTKYSVNIQKNLTIDKLVIRENALNESFSQGRINAEIYAMGKELNSFLRLYVDIKKNVKDKNNQVDVLKDYREFCSMYSKIKKSHDEDKVFEECFDTVYQTYIKDVEENVLSDDSFKNVKDIASLLENGVPNNLSQQQYEETLGLLKSVSLTNTNDTESLKIMDLISKTETMLLNNYFTPMISDFEKAPSFYECQRLISFMEKTKCEKCYNALNKVVEHYKQSVNEKNAFQNSSDQK